MPVTQTIVFTSTPPTTGETPSTFNYNAIACWNELKLNVVPDLNTAFTQMNALETNVNAKESSAVVAEYNASISSLSAQGSANYQGAWTSKGYTVGQTVSDANGIRWLCKLTHTTAQTAVEGTYWTIAIPYIGAIGNINSPLLDMPLKNSLAMKSGVGSATFTRASTATYIDRYGVLKTAAINEPRFEKEGYLNEGDSTNLLKYSEQFDNAIWIKTRATISANTTETLDPYGTNLADKLLNNGIVDLSGYISHPYTWDGTSTYTASIFVKSAEQTSFSINFIQPNGFTPSGDVILDMSAETLSRTANTSLIKLSNGWYRFSISVVPEAGAGSVRFTIPIEPAGTTNGVYIFGAQLEALPFASSYIPTVASTVTRSADNLSVTAINNIGQASSDKTILVDFDSFINIHSLERNIFRITGITNCILRANSSSASVVFYNTSGVTVGSLTSSANRRQAIVISATGFVGYVNGLVRATSTGTVTGTPVNICIGCNGNNAYHWYGHISNLRIYDKSLTAQEVALA